MAKETELAGRVAWVVGAAGALGAAIARRFAAEGARVVVSGRRLEPLAALAAELGGGAVALVCDVSESGAADRAVTAILAKTGRIDILVNGTTLPVFGDFLELTDEDWQAVLQAKLMGYVRTMRAVLPHMRERGDGRIVNITGRGGRQPSPVHLIGGAANAALNLVSKGLADMYGRDGVRINTLGPGPIASPRLDALTAVAAERPRGYDPSVPLGRSGTPDEVAEAALYLASDRSSYVTGHFLLVDGGGLRTV